MKIAAAIAIVAVLAYGNQARADEPPRYQVTQAPITSIEGQRTETIMWETATGRTWILRTIPSPGENTWTTVWVPVGFIPGGRRPDASLLPPNR